MNLRVCLLAVSLVAVGAAIDPAAATADDPTPAEMVAIFDNARLPGVGPPQPIALTGNQAADARVRNLAESRGYRLRPVASAPLVAVHGQRVQPAVAVAWAQLRAAAAASGHSMFVLSGFRSPSEQQPIFFGPLGPLDPSAIAAGAHDAAISARLAVSSAPGYSKHHSGYAIDITQVGTYFTDFGTTASYRWLAADNFRRARSFGFLPSYPDGVADLGPRPEPWELVWVGVDLARGTMQGDRIVVRTGRDFRVLNDDGSSAQEFTYGAATDTRFLLGDWDGNGTDTLAVRRGNTYYLRNTLTSGPADTIIGYGTATDTILVGDWDGNGTDTLAVIRDGAALLRDALTSGPATRSVLGVGGDEVLIGRP
jgi:LAS superfamily LD-carboxypeptidase LdcB